MMNRISLAAWAMLTGLALAGCGSGGNAALTNPGGSANAPLPPLEADSFLPAVNTVDSGNIGLTNGLFNGSGENLVFTEPFSTSRVRITDQTVFSGPDQIFDTDGDGDYEYIVLTMRALSAQAGHSVTASGALGALVDPRTFYKAGGIAILPPEAAVSSPLEVTLPVHPSAAPTAGKQFQLYRWDGFYEGPQSAFNPAIGRWVFISNVTVDSTGNTVTFSVSRLGEYAIAGSTINLASGT